MGKFLCVPRFRFYFRARFDEFRSNTNYIRIIVVKQPKKGSRKSSIAPKGSKILSGCKISELPRAPRNSVRFSSVQRSRDTGDNRTGPRPNPNPPHHPLLPGLLLPSPAPQRSRAEEHPTGPFLLPPVRPASPNFLRSARPPNPTNTTPVSFLGSNQSSVFFVAAGWTQGLTRVKSGSWRGC